MKIIDQNKFTTNNHQLIKDVHLDMIKEDILFEMPEEISATGLTIMVSAGIDVTDIKEFVNPDLTEYDVKLRNGKKFKFENVSFL